jgi:hypothetical protein
MSINLFDSGGGGATYFKRGERVVTAISASAIGNTTVGDSVITITAPTGKVINIEYLRSDQPTNRAVGLMIKLDGEEQLQGAGQIEASDVDTYNYEQPNTYSIGAFASTHSSSRKSGFARRTDVKCKSLDIVRVQPYVNNGLRLVYSIGEYIDAST